MKRIPTMSINSNGISMSKVIPAKLGEVLSFDVDREKKQIIISKEPGQHMALIKYPADIPIIKSMPLIKWIKSELGNRDYSKMVLEWDGERFTAQTNQGGK